MIDLIQINEISVFKKIFNLARGRVNFHSDNKRKREMLISKFFFAKMSTAVGV